MNETQRPTEPLIPTPRKRTAATAAKQPKESRGEEIVHELFRIAGVDLRSSAHGSKLAAEFGKLLHGGK